MDATDIKRGDVTDAMDGIARGAAPKMDDLSRRRVRKRLMRGIRSDAAVVRARRIAQRASAAAVALTLSAGYVPMAAAASLPGEPLYGVKRAIEEARLNASFGEHRALLLGVAADERARELVGLVEGGAGEAGVDRAGAEFDRAAERAFGESENAWDKSLRKAVSGKPEKVSDRAVEAAKRAHAAPGDRSGAAKRDGGKSKGKPNGVPGGRSSGGRP